ncbi:MAG: response regulator transcription factor [Lachnospiraceae bacterium]|nr:response regulator transcription factor [Lachnospiraceae bacterium]MDE6981704.1 response regulator transcription factor [Lachnospiraceae bacterium]
MSMKVLVQGQDFNWVKRLKEICREKNIDIAEGESSDQQADLLVSDSALNRGKGILREIPFLIVSEKEEEKTILQAFKQGAEDYLISPVSPSIAAARIEGILKRYGWEQSGISYTPNEYRLISFMMRHPYHVLSREQILEGAFPGDYEGIDRNVDNYIKDIRKKVKAAGEPERIFTVYGAGYRYVPEGKK